MKQHILLFTYQEEKHSIPSELFPLTQPQDIIVFDTNNTEKITDEKIINIINTLRFEVGRCYENAYLLTNSLMTSGINAFFCSGWLFAGGFPIHHAWVIIMNNEKIHLVDTTFHKVTDVVLNRLRGKSDIRSELKALWDEEMEKRGRNTDKIIDGAPPEHLLYIGNPDSYESAKRVYNEILSIKNHPSCSSSTNYSIDCKLQMSIKEY